MATIKSYTDIPQSKTLSKILPLESADMSYYIWKDDDHLMSPVPFVLDGMEVKNGGMFKYIPSWSLAALLGVLPDGTDIVKDKTDTENEKYMCTVGVKDDIISTFGNNPIDACVEMIEKLNESKLL